MFSCICFFLQFKGEYLYLLKWKGYSDADNTWEPATHLYCSDLLEKYITEHNLFGKNDKTEVSREEIKLSQRKQEGKGSLKLYPNSKLISNSQESYLTTAVSGNGRVVNCATTLEKKVKTGQTNSELLVHIKLSKLCPCGSFHKRRSMQALLNHSLWCIDHDHTYFTTQEVRSSTVSQSTNAPCSSHLMLKNRSINSSYGLSHSHIEIPSDDSDLASTANKSTDISKSTASYDLKLYLSPSSSTLTASETETGDLDDNSDSDGLFHPISSLPCAHAFVGKRQVLDAKSRWKGPMPLPRSFSKKQPHQARLKTKAAKVVQNCGECVTGGTRNTSEKGKTKVPISTQLVSLNGTKHVSEKPKSEKPKYVVPILKISPYEKSMSHKLAIDAAYKEVLMNWQFALNEQRGGTDNIIIVENEVDRVLPPTNFKYASSNIYRSGVPDPSSEEMSSSLCGCECYFLGRKCGPKSEYCCARMAGSTFAYTPRGKLCVPPGTPIYECNTKCTCPMDCPNRIVQLGRQFPLTIFRTRGRGWGVKTTQPIKVNTFVSEYVGEVINNEEAERRGVQCDAQGITYLFDLDFEDDCSAFTVDAANYGNISHFFNHSVSFSLFWYGTTLCNCLNCIITSVDTYFRIVNNSFENSPNLEKKVPPTNF